MGLTVLRPSTIKLLPNIISYSSCKYFNENKILHELDQDLTYGDFYMTEDTYSKVTEIFCETINKYTAVKSKNVSGNNTPLINKELNYHIVNKSTSRISQTVFFLSYRKNEINVTKT